MPKQLQVLAKPCSSGTCPAIYQDAEGRLFLQGNKLTPDAKEGVAIAKHEEIVEISPTLIEHLRTL